MFRPQCPQPSRSGYSVSKRLFYFLLTFLLSSHTVCKRKEGSVHRHGTRFPTGGLIRSGRVPVYAGPRKTKVPKSKESTGSGPFGADSDNTSLSVSEHYGLCHQSLHQVDGSIDVYSSFPYREGSPAPGSGPTPLPDHTHTHSSS